MSFVSLQRQGVVLRFVLGVFISLFFFSTRTSIFELTSTAYLSLQTTIFAYTLYQLVALLKQEKLRNEFVPLVADFALAFCLSTLTGAEQSLFTLIFFLPVLSASHRWRVTGGAITAFLASALLILSSFPHTSDWPRVLTHALSFFAVGLMGGIMSARLRFATERILKLEEINTAIIENMPSGLLLLNEQHELVSANPSGRKLLGMEDHLPSSTELFSRFDEPIQFAASTPEDRLIVGYKHPRLGQRDFGYSIAELPDPLQSGKKALLLAFQDLTKIRQIEFQLWNTKKLASVGRLAASIAHEIRNPLASISGSVEMLSSLVPKTDETQTLLRIVLKETDRLNNLISEFLDYVRQDKIQLLRTDLTRVLSEVFEELKLRKDKQERVQLVFTPPHTSIFAAADSNKLRQALLNLLINAVQAVGAQGTVTLGLQVEGTSVRISVSDTGTGIKADNLEKIFDPFFTTKEKGTGLGLAMTQKIIELHQGKISVESKPQRGTTFTVWLPLAGES